MKKFLPVFFVSMITLVSFAQPQLPQRNDAQSELTSKCFNYLEKQIRSDSVTLAGQVRPEDNLNAIIDDLGAYLGNTFGKLFSLGFGDDDMPDEPTTVADLAYSCGQSKINNYMAACAINITHKSGEKTELKFEVILDVAKKEPQSILQKTINITHAPGLSK